MDSERINELAVELHHRACADGCNFPVNQYWRDFAIDIANNKLTMDEAVWLTRIR